MISTDLILFLFLFLPGIIGVTLINYIIRTYRRLGINEWIVYSFALSLVCYLIVFRFTSVNVESINDIIKKVIITITVSLGISIVLIKVINQGLLHSLFRKLHISNTLGRKYILINKIHLKEDMFVHLRFTNKNLTYSGTITAVDIHDNGYIELQLKEAGAIYDNNKEFSYIMAEVLIFEKVENLIFEFPNL
ncbi:MULTISPECIES: hypothetical protein [unclassified Fusobacterium]|uniref:hypothetical protein n=1 Tax=unclassified Fusobacterium TaxID=2648384 RepID=UPI001B8BCF64|nr:MULTISPECIES: hypothetical protein [unclassified Fusobacterium]MBR8701655.1 hypothetical protein [Fusobacterium sp. DD45]MBR8711436.1 hypothetical protein [Fusobacterium sp. DD28]MBR8751985.1 hypothetical protein [Fusobacterium sp. DD26]